MLKTWYNKYIVARWYSSMALWVGVLAGLIEYLPDWLQALYDNFGVASDALFLTDSQRRATQAVLLFVVLPIARAWRQKKMTEAAIKQALVRNLNDEADATRVDKAPQ